MGTIAAPWSSLTAFTISLNSLANDTYVAGTAVDVSSIDPEDLILQLEVTPGTVSSEKGAYLFLQGSFDGTNYGTGPTSGTSATDEANLLPVGFLPLNTNSTLQRKQFPVLSALGFVPPWIKPVVRNRSGAAFAGSGCALSYGTLLGSY
jgi:hypothetical protein